MKGVIIFVVFTFVKALSFVVCKVLFDREPNLQPFPMLFIRSVFGIVLMAAIINTKLKRDTWDCVTRDKVGSLVLKTLASSSTNIVQYFVAKYLQLTIISIVINMAPVFVFILAFLILKEVIKWYDLMMMLLTLAGIVTVIQGSEREN